VTNPQETVELLLDDRTAWVTLARPPLNILDIPMMEALDTALERAIPNCDFVVFQGAGPKAFSAGAEIADHAPERVEKMLSAFHAVFRRLAEAGCLKLPPYTDIASAGAWSWPPSAILCWPQSPRSLDNRKLSSVVSHPSQW
jgi:cyclohexa-1,5-dienecarbonyl-CoA hydratase